MAIGKVVMCKEGSVDMPLRGERYPVRPGVEVALNIGPLGGSLATVSVIVVVPSVTVLVPTVS